MILPGIHSYPSDLVDDNELRGLAVEDGRIDERTEAGADLENL